MVLVGVILICMLTTRQVDAQSDTSWWDGFSNQGLNGAVNALAVYNGLLIAAGDFTIAGQVAANHVAAWDGSAWHGLGSGLELSPANSPPNTGYQVIATALAVYEGDLIVGGAFDVAGGVPVLNAARWDGLQWHPFGTPGDHFGGGRMLEFAIRAGQLVAAVDFGASMFVLGWDGSSWQTLSSPYVFTTPQTAYASGGVLYVGGPSLARWDGTNWSFAGTGQIPNGWDGPIRGMTTFSGELIVGGGFRRAGLTWANYVARWDGYWYYSLGLGFDNDVRSLAVHEGQLVAAGPFRIADGKPARSIATWDGRSWHALGSGIASTDLQPVRALATYAGSLYVGGKFELAGGNASPNMARWSGPLPSDSGLPIPQVSLGATYPNPFNPTAFVPFSIPHAGRVAVSIFDARGRLVTTLLDEVRSGGHQIVQWNGCNTDGHPMPSGVYVARLDFANESQSRKVTLAR